jgi:hypothetical protein
MGKVPVYSWFSCGGALLQHHPVHYYFADHTERIEKEQLDGVAKVFPQFSNKNLERESAS